VWSHQYNADGLRAVPTIGGHFGLYVWARVELPLGRLVIVCQRGVVQLMKTPCPSSKGVSFQSAAITVGSCGNSDPDRVSPSAILLPRLALLRGCGMHDDACTQSTHAQVQNLPCAVSRSSGLLHRWVHELGWPCQRILRSAGSEVFEGAVALYSV
jgi:hypothetical protein